MSDNKVQKQDVPPIPQTQDALRQQGRWEESFGKPEKVRTFETVQVETPKGETKGGKRG